MRLIYRFGYALFGGIWRNFFDYQYFGTENVPREGGALIASNHVSFVDPPTVGLALPHREVYFVARKTLFRNAIIGWFFRNWNAIPINQDRPELGSLKEVIRLARAGEQVVLFPEGSRSFDGELLDAQPGVGFILEKSGVPVVPARIFGGLEVMPRGQRIPQPGSVAVVFGEPIDFTDPAIREGMGEGKELYQAIGDKVMEAIAQLEDPR